MDGLLFAFHGWLLELCGHWLARGLVELVLSVWLAFVLYVGLCTAPPTSWIVMLVLILRGKRPAPPGKPQPGERGFKPPIAVIDGRPHRGIPGDDWTIKGWVPDNDLVIPGKKVPPKVIRA